MTTTSTKNFQSFNVKEEQARESYRDLISGSGIAGLAADESFETGNNCHVCQLYEIREAAKSVSCTIIPTNFFTLNDRTLHVRILLRRTNSSGCIVVSLTKLGGENVFNFAVGEGDENKAVYQNSSFKQVPFRQTIVEVKSGMVTYFCFYYVNNELRMTYNSVAPGNRTVYLWKAVVVPIGEVDLKNRNYYEDQLDGITVNFQVDDIRIRDDKRIVVKAARNCIDASYFTLIRSESIKQISITSPPTETTKSKVSAVPSPTASGESSAITDIPAAKPLSIEEVATIFKTSTDLLEKGADVGILDTSNLTNVRLGNVVIPGFMEKSHAGLVNAALRELVVDAFGTYTEYNELCFIVGMLQGALTFSTCVSTTKSASIVQVIVNDRVIELDYNIIAETIRDAVKDLSYSNAVRQYMRWFSATTIALIKSGKLVTNKAVQAKHGVVEQYIPYCFDFCVLDSRYNSRDEKISNALARSFAINQSLKRGKQNNNIHNTLELSYNGGFRS